MYTQDLTLLVSVINKILSLVSSEPPSTPGGPLVVSEVLKHSMVIAWQPPHSDGGSPITGYIIESRDSQSLTGWSRVDRVRPHIYSYTVTHLVQGHRYLFRVIAENAVGRSMPLETRVATEASSPYSKCSTSLYLHKCGYTSIPTHAQ